MKKMLFLISSYDCSIVYYPPFLTLIEIAKNYHYLSYVEKLYPRKGKHFFEFFRRINNINPDLICVSVMFENGMPDQNQKVLKKLKNRFTILGGGASIEFVDSSLFDKIIIGPGEYEFDKYLSGNIDSNYTTIKEVPIETYDVYLNNDSISNDYPTVAILSRGCPNNCGHCLNGNSTHYSRRTVDQSIQIIKNLVEIRKQPFIYLEDDNICPSGVWFEEFANRYNNEINLPLRLTIGYNHINENVISILKTMNISGIWIGFECYSDRIRKDLLKRNIDIYSIRKSILDLQTINNIDLEVSCMIGLPTETKEDIWNTIRFVGELKISKPKFHIFYPFKNTQLYQYCVDNNIIDYSKATGNVSMRETCFINQDFDSHFLYNTLYKLPAYLNLYVSKKTNLLFSEISKMTDLNKYRKRFNSMSDYCKLKRIEHYGYCAHVPYLFSDFNNYKIPSFYKTMYFGEL